MGIGDLSVCRTTDLSPASFSYVSSHVSYYSVYINTHAKNDSSSLSKCETVHQHFLNTCFPNIASLSQIG